MSEKIDAPCPFCGEKIRMEIGELLINCVVVICNECGANGPIRSTPSLAIRAWNRRAAK